MPLPVIMLQKRWASLPVSLSLPESKQGSGSRFIISTWYRVENSIPGLKCPPHDRKCFVLRTEEERENTWGTGAGELLCLLAICDKPCFVLGCFCCPRQWSGTGMRARQGSRLSDNPGFCFIAVRFQSCFAVTETRSFCTDMSRSWWHFGLHSFFLHQLSWLCNFYFDCNCFVLIQESHLKLNEAQTAKEFMSARKTSHKRNNRDLSCLRFNCGNSHLACQ